MPRFIVRFFDVAFLSDDTKDEIVLEMGEHECRGFSEVRAAEGEFPKGVLAVRRVHASPDDSVYRHGRDDGDVKLDVTVELEVEAEDEDQANRIGPPVRLLTELVDLLPRGSELGLEGSWEIEEVEPVGELAPAI